MSAAPTPPNQTLFQAFEWHTPSTPPEPHETHHRKSHYSRLTRLLPDLAALGISALLIPPGCKANNPNGNGYDCYDLWDLGEFDQKWSRSTKWGSREELNGLVRRAKELRVDVVWDAVLNHKTAGDATEECWAAEVDQDDRRVEICPPRKIEAWLRYEFPGRAREGMKYSTMKWRAEHFNGTDWDQRTQKLAIYKIIDDPATKPRPVLGQVPAPAPNGSASRPASRARDSLTQNSKRIVTRRHGRDWATDVGQKFGNYDYLMFSNIYYGHPEVREEMFRWGRWMVQDVGVDGFRLDAVQHFSWTFTRQWIATVQAASQQQTHRKSPWLIGEFWADEVTLILRWLDTVTPQMPPAPVRAFDVPLVLSFSRVSEDVRTGSGSADLRTFLSGPGNDPDKRALVSLRPQQAVTFVTNHDTQIGQACFTPMDSSLKALFYAFILLRLEGQPCVFWGDLYGTKGPHAEEPSCRMKIVSATTTAEKRFIRFGKSSVQQKFLSKSVLPSLVLARKIFAYGAQTDYFDSMACIGWTRAGVHDRPGCVVIMSIDPPEKWTIKKMLAGRPGEKWVDIMREVSARPEVVIDRKGFGVFTCAGRTVGVFVREDYVGLEKFPIEWNEVVC